MCQRMVTVILLVLVLLLGGAVAARAELGYYLQAVRGQWQMLAARRAISAVLADPATPPALKARLTLVLQMRDFASRELLLPENDSYRFYADLGRSAVVWNVVATPEFSLEPVTWCFPVAGCVSYRGYFREAAARAFAEKLQRQGYDVDLYGVAAYSTLGWFDDPVLNTFVNFSEPALAGMIFHELAHQKFYVKDDTSFSEAFAELISEEGVTRWQQGRELTASAAGHRTRREERTRSFVALLLATRKELETLYASALPDEELRAAKARILAELPLHYQAWRDGEGQGDRTFDDWFERPLNNARLAAVATYHDFKPALAQLLQNCDGDLRRFYAEVETLAAMPRQQRRERLTALEAPGRPE